MHLRLMPNQRAIAKLAGVNQATVSLALRNSPSIPQDTRERIQRIAEELGYRPNSYVSTLMSHIRSGRPPQDKGCIAIIGNRRMILGREDNWPGSVIYRQQYNGMTERASALGFTTETFNIGDSNLTMERVDDIMLARGINGLILAAPNHVKSDANLLSLDRLATATIAYSWKGLKINRVTTHHRHNVQTAYGELRRRGFRRIGMCLPPEAATGVDDNWQAGHLIENMRADPGDRIPLFVGKPGETPREDFVNWLEQWKPEAMVGLLGHEKVWLDELGIRIPQDISVVCVNRLPGSEFTGTEENHEVIGAAAVDLVAAQLIHNEFGLPKHPKLLIFEGTWVEGHTVGKPRRRRK